ncbi:argininosuccinate lyase [Ruegeria sp. SCSIO 43209]|uniref:argininosuccinate lyase n=1 Tax=Ruegeria sp. SCSIO 43209 TaxID=2793010 RepID=UPI0014818A4A|nr:argininosuccinate lyase [Ruegeria sp. SCSIO 43209]UAB89266.1 argininosuccinate lyase [Ruegeria sp. SCSIO 43209]
MQIRRVVLLIAVAAALAGCGADGEPIQPTMSASVGVGSSGTYGGVGVGLRRGGLGVYLGL